MVRCCAREALALLDRRAGSQEIARLVGAESDGGRRAPDPARRPPPPDGLLQQSAFDPGRQAAAAGTADRAARACCSDRRDRGLAAIAPG